MSTQLAITDNLARMGNLRGEVPEEQHSSKTILEKALNNWSKGEAALPARWDFAALNTQSLVAHINAHHAYIRETLSEALRLGAIVSGAGDKYFPETIEIYEALVQLEACIKHHLTSEEYALFPYILEMENVRDNKLPFAAPKLGRVEQPIRAIEDEHLNCICLLNNIRVLSGWFTAAAGASQEHRVWYGLLKQLDADFHLHIHLENNILFPRAIALESELLERKGFAKTSGFGRRRVA